MIRSKLPHFVLLAVVASCSDSTPDPVTGQTQTKTQLASAPPLGTTNSFAVLGGSTVTNTGSSVVTGDLGVSPGSAVTGFPPGLVLGTIAAANAAALQAQSDATVAYNALAGQACNTDLTGQDLGGKTLTAGTYCLSSSAQLTGTLTLNAEGDPAAVFVFQIGSTLTTASNANVVMINGGNSCNVFFQVGTSATLGTATQFAGNIFALTSITLNTGASLSGRAIARNGAVTLDTNGVSSAACKVGATVDAGTPVIDAGTPAFDGGAPVVDAGLPFVDAGTGGGTGSDAGAPVVDAGTGGGMGSDAGTPVVDAGSEDAGNCIDEFDAGTPFVDAGTGGGMGSDAGTPVDAGEVDAGQCVDIDAGVICGSPTDHDNCGTCGTVCGATEACVAGICICAEP